jgi:hypothetical protein
LHFVGECSGFLNCLVSGSIINQDILPARLSAQRLQTMTDVLSGIVGDNDDSSSRHGIPKLDAAFAVGKRCREQRPGE